MWTQCRFDASSLNQQVQAADQSLWSVQDQHEGPGHLRQHERANKRKVDMGNTRQSTAKQQTLSVACPWVEPRGRNQNVTAASTFSVLCSLQTITEVPKVQDEGPQTTSQPFFHPLPCP